MATSKRPRPSNPAGRSTNTSRLPPYEPATHPLNADAQRALHELPRAHRLDGLRTHLSQAINNLTAAAGDINDRSQQKFAHHQKRKARRQARAAAPGEEEDENENENDSDYHAVEEMHDKVEEMTVDLELRVRKIVDARAAVENVTMVLKELDANLTNGQGAIMPTQSTLGASQLREKRRRVNVDLSDDEAGDEDTGPTAPLGVFKQKVDIFHSEYENSSLRHRYASNNDYIGFKKIVHDARHPQHDAPPMPHASTWFPRSGSTSPSHNPSLKQNKRSKSAAPNNNNNEDDDDDEIEVASERISINCPITLRPMQVPVSSSVCPHSFERAAVLEMISKSPIPPRVTSSQGGSGREKQMQCPVSGCNAILAPSLLHPDLVLTRKIKRLLHAPQPSPSPSPPPFPSSSKSPKKQRKTEPSSSSSRNKRFKKEVSMVPATQLEGGIREEEEEEGREEGSGTQIVDLGDGGGDEEDEDEEGDEEGDEDE